MLEVFATAEFEKRYRELPAPVRKKAVKQETLFRENPFYPSLHTEKLEPRNREVWSFRIDKKHRIIFRFLEENKVLLLTVGPHDWVYRFKF
jgi:mRNA-degrading endonuclease RelE of RelBE toxin-antitoxin system